MNNYTDFVPGNLVLFKDIKVIIESIHSKGRTDVGFKISNTTEPFWATIEKLSPLPLTKEIMGKLDFEYFFDTQKETTYYHHKIARETDKSFFITEFAGCFKLSSVLFKSIFVRISSVHELQNLFYKMKKELPIKKLLGSAAFSNIQLLI